MTETGRRCRQLLIQGLAHSRQNISDSGSVVCGNLYLLAQGEQCVTKETRRSWGGGVGGVGRGLGRDNCAIWLPKMILHIIDTNSVENEMKGILVPRIFPTCV